MKLTFENVRDVRAHCGPLTTSPISTRCAGCGGAGAAGVGVNPQNQCARTSTAQGEHMNRDDIRRLSSETGICRLVRPQRHEDMTDMLEQFAALVAAAEREAIAQMFDDPPPMVPDIQNKRGGCLICGFTPAVAAKAIRARGNT